MKMKSLLRNVILALSLFSALLIGACNENQKTADEVVGISFPSDTLYLSVGMSKEILYSVVPAELQESAEINWTSSKESVVTVSSEGVATGVDEGKAKIVAQSGNANASLNVVVSKAPKSGISLSEGEFTMEVGDTKQLSYTISSAGYEEEVPAWESGNPAVASVNNEGLVTAKSVGESLITVTVGDLVAHAIVIVFDNESAQLEGLVLSNDDVEVYVNESYKVYCYTVPTELQGQVEITWEILDEDVALITDDGVIFGVSPGTTGFRASSGSIVVEGDVAVVLPLENQLENIELNVTDLKLGRGDWFEFVYTLTPSYLQDYLNVSWESTDESIAEVDAYGIVVAKQYGECDIIATCDGLTASAHITVVDDTEYGLTLAKSKVLLPYGKTYTMDYYITPSEYQDQAWVTWESSNPEIATVDEYGVISSGEAPGTATITARWEGCEDSAEVTVFTMFLGKEKMEMTVGDTEVIPLYVMPDEQELILQASYSSQDKNVVQVSENGVMTAVGTGTCEVYVRLSTMTVAVEVTVAEEYHGYNYVDLGLPSGTKWATHNVDADDCTQIGGYYAWGELTTKSEYTDETSETDEVDMGDVDFDIAGWLMYDVASSDWGTPWRIPNYDQWQELIDECDWSWDYDLPGHRVQGPNGNVIYLIAAGQMAFPGLVDVEELYYWTSTTATDSLPGWADEDRYACYFKSTGPNQFLNDMGPRCLGMQIRPVLPY